MVILPQDGAAVTINRKRFRLDRKIVFVQYSVMF